MPSTVIATDKLQEFTGAEDEKMRRYLDAPDALEIRVLVPIKLIGKQVLYMVSAILARWQADRMQHNQVNLRSIWARAKIWRWALICQRVPCLTQAAVSPFTSCGLIGGFAAVRCVDVESGDAIAYLAQA